MDTRVIFAEGIRSLVATPLTTENKIVGILFVDDYKPRIFSKRDISILELLSTQATIAIKKAKIREQLQRNNQKLKQTMDYLQNVLDNSADMIITTDIENNVVEFNKGAQEILGYTQSESVEKPLRGFFANPDHCNQLLEKSNKKERYPTRKHSSPQRKTRSSISVLPFLNSKTRRGTCLELLVLVGTSPSLREPRHNSSRLENSLV